MHATPNNQKMSAEPAPMCLSTVYSPFQAVPLLSQGWVGVGGSVITRFKAKSQFKLDLTGTGTELILAKLKEKVH